MKQLPLVLLFSLFSVCTWAQTPQGCSIQEITEQYIVHDPSILNRQNQFNLDAKKQEATTLRKSGTVRIIPVVFHVIYKTGTGNISDAQIDDAIAILNDNFRRRNANAVNTRSIFEGVAGDMEIEFRLARKDPKGNCTNGIVRLYDAQADNGSDSIKQRSIWPADKYLNIWVLEQITHPTFGQIKAVGYSQYPWIARPSTDGITIIHSGVGSIGTANPFSVADLTHEAGHWLGCYHTFENDCTGGDMVDDTPPCAANRFSIFGCDTSKNTCSNDSPDLPDQIENYMDYATSACQNMFTIGQKARMDAALTTWRPFITTLQNLVATGTDQATTTANCTPIAGFRAKDNQNALLQTACINGKPIQFIDASYNYTGAISYQWIFENGTPAFSNQQNPTVQYQDEGKYDVTLIVNNANGYDTLYMPDYIEVLPQVAALKAPFVQGFESPNFPDNGWRVGSNSFTNFAVINVGVGAIIKDNPNTLFIENSKQLSFSSFDLYSPSIDISGMNAPVLSFYFAFASRPTNTAGNYTNDALKIFYSVDCEQTWNELWVRKGNQLSTLGGSTPGSSLPFVPADASKWKQVLIDMPNGITQSQKQNISFKIQFVSAGGNNFYLDALNIGFPASTQLNETMSFENFTVFPNPSNGQAKINIELISSSDIKLSISDISGKIITTLANGSYHKGQHSFYFDAKKNNIDVGIYFIRLLIDDREYHKKIVLTN